MRIALNLLYLLPGQVGGTETYARGLLAGLACLEPDNEFVVYMNQESAELPLPNRGRFRRVLCPLKAASRPARYWFEQTKLPALFRVHGVDVGHSLGYVGPVVAGCPAVVTVHDLNYLSAFHSMPTSRRMILRAFVWLSVRRADAVIVDAQFGKREVCTRLGVEPERVHVVNLAPSEWASPEPTAGERRSILETLGIAGHYALAFSGVSANKNVPRLLRAFAKARIAGIPHSLVLVGRSPEESAERLSRVDGTIPDWLRITGYLDEPSLRAVLAGADFLVFPSLYEGFGLPVLEAMSQGVPVACSRAASLPEVAGDAAEYFDPSSDDDMARAIGLISMNLPLREKLSVEGRRQAARFSWERSARETLAVYKSVLRANRQGGA